MAREFEIRREVELPGTPEDVWEAVATGEGNAAWLFPNLVDRDDATVWEPPHRLVIRMEGEDGWFNQIEDVIEARDGGTTVLRYVHSGIFTEDWDNQYDGADQHTDFYLHTLGQYLEHFKGRPVTYIGGDGSSGLEGPEASTKPGSFGVLKRALGVGDDASIGDRVRFGPDAIEGVVDYVHPHFVGIRTADGLYRFFGRDAWGLPTGMSAHLFADGVDKERTESAWSEWLKGLYA
jgi:uncharacterized protein YndB with AHSA1/START domain